MTNREIIEILQYMRHDVLANSDRDIALVKAIEALKKTDCMCSEDCTCDKHILTNADKIRQMTDDELCHFLDRATDSCNYRYCDECPLKYSDKMPRCNISEWLKQEVQEDAGND